MGEIKVRGWHVEKQRMFSCEEMVRDQLTLLTDGRFINVHGGSTARSTIFDRDKFIPLRFTGLKDKNGREIYEGDIVQHLVTMTPKDVYKIKVVVHRRASMKLDPRDGGFLTPLEWPHFKCLEVIGNIYENPELLKAVNND